MRDIVSRLRKGTATAIGFGCQGCGDALMAEAADDIERLRTALDAIVAHDEVMLANGIMKPFVELERAQRALKD